MARPNGVVIDGPEANNQWFTDGYGDYIRHFMTSLGAVPVWAPDGQNHLVRPSSIVTNVNYSASGINYTTSDNASTETLRINFTPASVIVDGMALSPRADLTQAGWTFDPVLSILQVRHDVGTNVQITSVQATLATTTTSSLPGGTQHVVYSALLAGAGGTLPYTWSIASGALPTGLTLTSGTGVISGTATATGTFSVTARVTVANGQSVTKPLSLSIGTVVTLWPGTAVPGVVDGGPTARWSWG